MPAATEHHIDLQRDLGSVDKKKLRALVRKTKVRDLTISSATLVVILTVYLLRIDGVVGQFKDDAWYVILCKALATGNGYNLINLPQRSGFYFYPPLFPFLLSLLYRMWPDFPSNVPLLKSLSIASMLILPFLVFRLLNQEERLPKFLAYLVAFSTALAPSLVMMATSSIMSECVFTTLQFASLLWADSCRREVDKQSSARTPLITGILAAASILTRTIGIALIPAIAIDFLKQRIVKPLVIFLASAILCLAPWQVYKHLRSSAGTLGPVMPGYAAQFWDRLAGSQLGIKATSHDLPARAWQLSTVIIGDDVGAILAPPLYRFPGESGQEVIGMTAVIPKVSRNAIGLPSATMGLNISAQIISLGFSIVVFIGFVTAARRYTGAIELFFVFTLAIIVVWPWAPIRFLGPLVPLIFYYLLLGIMTIYRAISRKLRLVSPHDVWALSRVIMLCLVGLLLYDNLAYIAARGEGPTSWRYPACVREFQANKEAAEWIRSHVPPNEVVAGGNPAFVYLFSGHQTALCGAPQCAKAGIRYYMTTDDEQVSVPAVSVFTPNYHEISILELQQK